MMIRDMWVFSGMDEYSKINDLWCWNLEKGWKEYKFARKGPDVWVYTYYSGIAAVRTCVFQRRETRIHLLGIVERAEREERPVVIRHREADVDADGERLRHQRQQRDHPGGEG